MACLHLVDRCAIILLALRNEISSVTASAHSQELVKQLLSTLHPPVQKLLEAFNSINQLLLQQVDQPFIKRYLKRGAIVGDIKLCDEKLSDAMQLFSVSLQIRILKEVQAAERNRLEAERRGETETTIVRYISTELLQGHPTQLYTEDADPLLPSPSIRTFPSASPLDTIAALRSRQFALDTAADNAYLHRQMKAALHASSDSAMIELLEVNKRSVFINFYLHSSIGSQWRIGRGGQDASTSTRGSGHSAIVTPSRNTSTSDEE